MRLCPSPDCSHRKSAGRPAEYRDTVETCADCGTALVIGTLDDLPPRPAPAYPIPWRRVAWTALLIGLVIGLWFVPLPGVDMEVLTRGASWQFIGAGAGVFLFDLGIAPLLGALALVEQAHAIYWWIKKGRDEPRVRGRGWRIAAIVCTVAAAAVQAWQIDVWLRSIGWTHHPAVDYSTLGSLLRILALMAGSGVIIGLAWLLTRVGLSHGLALLIGLGAASRIVWAAIRLVEVEIAFSGTLLLPTVLTVAAGLALLGALVAVLWWLLRRARAPSVRVGGVQWPVNRLAGGVVPLGAGVTLLMVPITVSELLRVTLPSWFRPGSVPYLGVNLAVMLGFTWLYVALTWRPKHRLGLLVAHGLVAKADSPEGEDALAQLSRVRRRTMLATIGANAAILLIGFVIKLWSPNVGGLELSLCVVTAVGLDLFDEWRAWRSRGPQRIVTTTQDYDEATLIAARLRAQGVEPYLGNATIRSLTTFAGPHFPVAVQVPTDPETPLEIPEAKVKGALF